MIDIFKKFSTQRKLGRSRSETLLGLHGKIEEKLKKN